MLSSSSDRKVLHGPTGKGALSPIQTSLSGCDFMELMRGGKGMRESTCCQLCHHGGSSSARQVEHREKEVRKSLGRKASPNRAA